MATYRIKKDLSPYVVLNKDFLINTELSMQSKGLLAYLLSLPDDWTVNRQELPRHFKNGIGAISSALKELINAGYIIRSQKRVKGYRFGESVYDVYEAPQVFE
jgi:hypothetical protein